jgi:hypothetical protein
MAELKTQPTKKSVARFLDAIEDETRRRDAKAVAAMMEEATKEKPVMWGPSIVGFGSHPLKYASGRELDWPVAAFSPRKQSLTLYFIPGFEAYDDLMSKLGKYKTSKSCLYLKSLDDVHLPTLKKLIRASVKARKA